MKKDVLHIQEIFHLKKGGRKKDYQLLKRYDVLQICNNKINITELQKGVLQ